MYKVLIIEDEQDVRLNIEEILELEGFEVHTAENGQQGIAKAREHLPDIIICDIMMPSMNGYEVLINLQKTPKTMNIPFIFLTAKAASSDMRFGMRIGADDYIIKPFESTDLVETIQTRLMKRGKLKEELDTMRFQISKMIPHEFRTPLTSIRGYSALLADPEFHTTPESIVSMAKSIQSASIRLTRLVENYMLYTNLTLYRDQPKEMVYWTQTNALPLELFEELIKTKAEENNRISDLTMSLHKDAVTLARESCFKITEEIVDNALKFSDNGTAVTVSSEVTGNHLVLAVCDKGNGARATDLSKVGAFTQFNRELREQQGAGLGLTISHMLSEVTESSIQFEDNTPQGIKVKIRMPLAP